MADRNFQRPNWVSEKAPREEAIRDILFTMAFSTILLMLDNKLSGRYPFGVSLGLFGFGMSTHVACFQHWGTWPCVKHAL